MQSADAVIRDLEIMAKAVHYRDWIYHQFRNDIGGRVMEVGAGIGTFTELFLDRELVVAIDAYGPCVDTMKGKFARRPNVIALQMDIAAPEIQELCSYRPDTIVCLNVLEHIADDGAALGNMFSLLDEGGTVALLVPAFQSLYGSVDRLVGHQRRYSRKELRDKLVAAGLRVRTMFYMNSVAVFGWFLNNRILKRKEESLGQVLLYDRLVVPMLKVLEDRVKPPFGLSIVAVAEKKEQSRQ